MATQTLNNPSIPLDSIMLITGVNGLIGSHAADQILKAGYRVRGVVRNSEKSKWLTQLYESRHGTGRFELVEVPDMMIPNAWDDAIKNVAGIAHVAGGANPFITDVDAAVAEEMQMQTIILEAARTQSSVKSFAQVASAWGAYLPKRNTPFKLTEWSFNEDAIKIAASDAPQEKKGWAAFMAYKTRVEQETWAWIKQMKPNYTFNTLLLDTVIGTCLDPPNQGYPSTAGFCQGLFHGEYVDLVKNLEPQWYIDTEDTGKLFLAALVTPGCDGERLFGFGGRYSWPQIARIFKELAPNKKDIPHLEDNGVDIAEVPNQRAEELIRGVGALGWKDLKTSVRDNIQEFL